MWSWSLLIWLLMKAIEWIIKNPDDWNKNVPKVMKLCNQLQSVATKVGYLPEKGD